MRYVRAKYAEYRQALAYRIYITDSLYYSSRNQMLTKRYIDVIKPIKIEHGSGDEIAIDVIKRLGLKVSEDE